MWDDFCTINKIDSRLAKIISEDLKFSKITKVQFEVIPRFSKNQDVIVKACTGSGKTLAYVVPLFQQLINYHQTILDTIKENFGKDHTIVNKDEADHFYTTKRGVLGIILLPTRELAIQVYHIIQAFTKSQILDEIFSAVLLIGGKSLQYDIEKFSTESLIPSIIVATPSRLYDLVEKLDLEFKNTQVVVLDEADKMLEMGYLPKLSHLISRFNKQRRTGLFSATINSQLQNMIITGMRNPFFIDVKFESKNLEDIFINNLKNPDRSKISIIENYTNQLDNIKKMTQEIPMQLENYYIIFENYTEKFALLISLLERYSDKKLMVFFATCNSVDYYSTILGSSLSCMSIYKLHSKISKNRRKKDYNNFLKADGKAILLTTDLSSRGIDVPDIDLIIQYDPPKNEEVFIHRVGRTARVGKEGQSITLINSIEKQFINYMNLKKVKLIQMEPPEYKVEESLKILYNANTSDKWIYDHAVKAFVSFVKFYSEHDLKYIFDIKGLDIGDLANSFQLLRLPRIKEILGKNVKNFKQSEVDPSEIKYLDSNVEGQMAKKKEKSILRQEERKIRKEIGEIDRKAKYSRSKSQRKRIKNKNNLEEWNELAEEEKLYKKFKKGKITKDQYNSLFTK